MLSETKKILKPRLLLAFAVIFAIILQMAAIAPSIKADESNPSNFTELAEAIYLAGDSGQPETITLGGDITFEENLSINSNVTLTAEKPVTIELESYRIEVATGSNFTIGKNVTIHQSSSATDHPVAVRDNAILNIEEGKLLSSAASGSVYTIDAVGSNIHVNLKNATVTTSSPNGRAIYTNTPENDIIIEDSTITANTEGGYAIYRGNYQLRGNTSLTGKIGSSGTSLYDFRSISVNAVPGTDTYKNGDYITLEKTGDGKELAAGCKIYYTVDGSDPRTSDTAIEYTQKFRVPLGTIVKATLKTDRFAGSLYEFDYSKDHDTVPGTVQSFDSLPKITVPLYTSSEDLGLPTAMIIKLSDGREKYVAVNWDISSYDSSKIDTYTLSGTFELPDYITNPNQIKASINVEVIVAEISDFNAKSANFLKEGKTSVEKDAAVLTLSSKGGDAAPVYTLTQNFETDNNKFYIKNNEVLVKDSALTAGDYKVEVKVTAGIKSQIASFQFSVDAADPIYQISNPYEGIDWDSVFQVKAALHNHTVNTNAPIGEWSDGVSGTVDSRVPVYESLDYEAVAITDHDYVSYPWNEFGLENSGLISIAGNELSKNAHILSCFCTYFDQKGVGTSVTNGMIKNIENVEEIGGFLYIAHPNRSGGATQDPDYDLELLKYPQVREIEVLNAGQFTNNHSEDLWDTLLTQTMPNRPIWGTASDDSHSDGTSTIGTGWTYLLLPEKTEAATKEAMINGQTYFSSWRVVKGQDDNKENPNVPAPTIENITVDNNKGTITITAKDASKIEWISENGNIVATGNTVNVNTTPGAAKYIRARMFGEGGQTMTQLFGLLDSTNPDTVAPEINVNEKVPENGTVGSAVSIPTATATDDQDGAVFAYASVYNARGELVNTMDNSFTPQTGGTYTVTYRAKDAFQNVAEVSFKVKIPDTVKPEIAVSNVPSTGMVGKMIQLPEAVVTDDVSLNLTANILVSGPKGEQITLNNSSFIPQTAGIYTVTYSAVDEDNNRNSLSFEINVVLQQSQTDTDNTQQPNETETAKTGESKNIGWFFTTVLGSAVALILILQYRKNRKTSSTNQ